MLPASFPISESLRELVAEALRRGMSPRLRLLGGSMWPFLASGTVARVVPVAPWRVEAGDVVLCSTPQGFLAHRVMGRRNTPDGTALLITKGDALPFRDEPMPWEAVLGKVVDLEVRGVTAWRRAFLRGPGACLALAYSRLNPPLLLGFRRAKRAARRLLGGLSL